MDSVKVPYVICLTNPRWRHPRWRYPKWRPFVTCCLAPMDHFVHKVTFTTILEGNGVTFMFTTRQPLQIHCPGGRRLPNVYEYKRLVRWWLTQNYIDILGIGYSEKLVTVLRQTNQFREYRSCFKHMVLPRMTNDTPNVVAMIEESIQLLGVIILLCPIDGSTSHQHIGVFREFEMG